MLVPEPEVKLAKIVSAVSCLRYQSNGTKNAKEAYFMPFFMKKAHQIFRPSINCLLLLRYLKPTRPSLTILFMFLAKDVNETT